MSARILVVEDEPTLLQAVTYAVRREGFEALSAADGERALEVFDAEGADLIVLDLMLPKVSGLDVCRQIRATSAVPIVMLTAKDTELDVVLGLEVGADDYMTKPFSMAELIGRIRANLRRRELDRDQLEQTVRTLGGVRIDLARHEVTVDGRRVALTPSELRLLHFLADRPQQVYSRRQIMEHLWDSSFVGDEHACDVHISNLRRKLERDPRRPERIVTVRGFGYKLVPI
jgi:two-component system response regulator RegX3